MTPSTGAPFDVSAGLKPGGPLFVIPDSAPHSGSELRNRTHANVLQGAELDPVAGSIPGEKDSVEVRRALMDKIKPKR